MFEFEYDNFLDKYNGLKIVVRNTAGGAIISYAINNDGVVFYDVYNDHVIGYSFITYVRSSAYVAINMAIDKADFEYRSAKMQEVRELVVKQAEQFLLDYFQVEDMRDLLARDDFFDKQMFTS